MTRDDDAFRERLFQVYDRILGMAARSATTAILAVAVGQSVTRYTISRIKARIPNFQGADLSTKKQARVRLTRACNTRDRKGRLARAARYPLVDHVNDLLVL